MIAQYRGGGTVATLSISGTEELCLTLRGAAENQILETIRRLPYWRRVSIERDPVDAAQTVAVTLVTDIIHESTVRSILQRSFGLTFPKDGGDGLATPGAAASERRRR
jgi:hypothetical protein